MVEIKFDFREKLDAMIGGEMHSYCYQCGACVGDCPAARYSDRFNPRMIMLKTIVGQIDELLSEDSPIWECTNCYNCSERCPQGIDLAHIFVSIKNYYTQRGITPSAILNEMKILDKNGITLESSNVVIKRRAKMGLPKLLNPNLLDIQKILKTTGFIDLLNLNVSMSRDTGTS